MPKIHDLPTLRKLAKKINSFDLTELSAQTALQALIQFSWGFVVPGALYSSDNIWWRARSCETADLSPHGGYRRFDHISELLHRRSGNPNIGRCNLPGQTILYAASNIRTAALEIGAKAGDIIQLTSIRPVDYMPFITAHIGAYTKFDQDGEVPWIEGSEAVLERQRVWHPKVFKQSLFIDRFLCDIFNNAGEEKYILSAALSSYYIRSRRHGAIIYPSVKNKDGVNIAMDGKTFDYMFEVLETCVVEIESVDLAGDMKVKILFRADQFSLNGKPIWDSPPVREYGQYGHEIPRTPGWKFNSKFQTQ